MSALPMIATRLPLVRRSAGVVQVGLEPDTGLVIEGLDAAEVDFLEHLDGLRSMSALRRSARRSGLRADRVETLLSTLRERNLLIERDVGADPGRPWWVRSHRASEIAALIARASSAHRPRRADWSSTTTVAHPTPGAPPSPPPTPPGGRGSLTKAARSTVLARERCRVLIDGEGSLVDALVHVLRDAGVGRVNAGIQAGAVTEADHHAQEARRPAHAVVVVRRGAIAPDLTAGWRSRDVPVVPIVATEHTVHIGPVLNAEPGPRTPCSGCLELHRTDADPQWPAVLVQLARRRHSDRGVEVDAATTAVAAGLAGMLAVSLIDTGHRTPATSAPPGLSFQVRPQAYDIITHRWPVHADCREH